MQMSPSEARHPQFFKVFQPQHSSHLLLIPREFQNRLSGSLPKRVILRNCQGKLWPVEVGRTGINSAVSCFGGGGWSNFVLHHSLAMGEFLVFKYNGHHIFDVIILGSHGCQRRQLHSKAAHDDDDDEDFDNDDSFGDDSTD